MTILKKRFSSFLILLTASVATVALCPEFITARNRNAMQPVLTAEQIRAKARYYYLEGALKEAEGDFTEAYEYYKKAYLVDPTYEEAAASYGMNRLRVPTDSMQRRDVVIESFNMIRPFVDHYPAEINEGRAYAYVASQIDTIPEAIRVYEQMAEAKPTTTVTFLQLSDAYTASNQQEKALEALDRFEAREGNSPRLALKRMGLLLGMADTVGAIREADRLIATKPTEPAFWILKGNLFEVIGNNDSVLNNYSMAARLDPRNGAAKIALAGYYKQIGDSVAYDAHIYDALLAEDFELEDKLGMLSEYLQNLLDDKGDTQRGDHIFSVLSEQYPHEPQVLDLAARYNAAKGNYKEAIRQMGYALDLDPTNVDLWGTLMQFEVADSRGKDAIKTYERALAHIEPTESLKLLLASAASEAKDFALAEKTFGELIHTIGPELPLDSVTDDKALRSRLNYDGLTRLSTLYNMLGDMFYSAENLEKAYIAYDNSLFFYGENPMTLNNYAYFLSENNGDLEKALEMSKKAIEIAPDNETYLDTYAWVLFKMKDYAQALEYQEKAVEAAQNAGEADNAEFFSHLGDILFMNHRPEEALENWEKALKLDPDNKLLQKKVKHKTFFFE